LGRAIKVLTILLTYVLLSKAGELKACYRAYLFFMPVAETCINYREEREILHTESWVRTINIGKLVKRVYNRGSAKIDLKLLEPKHFVYYQEEGEFKRYQEYIFNNGKIRVIEVKYKGLTEEVERQEEKLYDYKGFVDPYTASLILYRESTVKDKGTVKMFYDDREYWLPYAVVGRETLKTPAGIFNTRVVEVQPNIETKGLLKPKGKWILWIDESTDLPIRMELKFVIGSASARIERIEGDRDILRRTLTVKRLGQSPQKVTSSTLWELPPSLSL
jgi:hypothetical protein